MGRRHPALLALTTLLSLSGCRGNAPPSATSTPPAVPTSPAPASPEHPGTPVNANKVVDLAASPPATVIVGADAGDMRSDLPALGSGEFNGDGVADILLGARFGDGPSNRRQDAGEAYVIFGSPGPPGGLDP